VLSVIIASYNSGHTLGECLTSLKSELMNTDAEVIVVDNGSTDGTSSMVSTRFPEVKLIRNAVNEYFVHGFNRAYKESSGEFVLAVNSDVIVVPGALHRLLDFMNSSPRVAVASCRVLTPRTGELQPTGGRFLTLTMDLFEWTRLGWLFPSVKDQLSSFHYMRSWDRSDVREVDAIVAIFMIFRRAAVEAVGGFFDNRFLMFFAEDELCWRLKNAGWKIYHLGDIFVYHWGRVVFNKMSSRFLSDLSLRDRLEYHNAVLGLTRALIFRIVLRIDSFLTFALKRFRIIE